MYGRRKAGCGKTLIRPKVRCYIIPKAHWILQQERTGSKGREGLGMGTKRKGSRLRRISTAAGG